MARLSSSKKGQCRLCLPEICGPFVCRLCALHPHLFECLLSGDVTAHAESIAEPSALRSPDVEAKNT